MVRGAIALRAVNGRIACIVVVLGRFQQHVCPNATSQFTYSCFLGDSTQLGNITENSVVRAAIAHRVFKVRFACTLRSFRPFSTAVMLCPIIPTVHILTRPGRIKPTYAIGLKTVW